MRHGVSEVGEHPIAEVLGDVPSVAHDQIRRALVIRAQQLEVVLRIEFCRELGRAHEIAEEHRELAPLGQDIGRQTRHASLRACSDVRSITVSR